MRVIHYSDVDELVANPEKYNRSPDDPTLCGDVVRIWNTLSPMCIDEIACEYCNKTVTCEECILLDFQNIAEDVYERLFSCEEQIYPKVTVHQILNLSDEQISASAD